jgi:DNA-binding transcriptional MocR family regulator
VQNSYQQSAVLAAIARYFPAQTRVSQPAGGYFFGWNCQSR